MNRMNFLICPGRCEHEGAMSYRWRLADANGLSLREAEAYFDYTNPELLNGPSGRQTIFHRQSYRYCACCLQSGDLIGRIGWEILFADACTKCGHWLVDTCIHCKARLTWRRKERLRCNCGHAFALCSGNMAPAALIRLSRTLENMSMGKAATDIPIVAHLTLTETISLIRLLGSYGSCEGARMPQKARHGERLEVSWRITTYAAEVLDRWPEGFHRLLDHLQKFSPQKKQRTLTGAFRGFYTAMYRSFAATSFDWLRRAFEDYLVEHWTGAVGRRNRRLSGHVLGRMQWIPASRAAKEIGISTAKLNALINGGKIDCEERVSAGGRRFRVVRQKSLACLPLPAEQELTLEQASQQFGLKRQRLSRLLSSLCPAASKASLHGTPWRIPSAWVEKWKAFIECQPLLMAGPTHEQMTFDHFLRYETRDDACVVRVLQACEAGQILPIGRVPALDGIGSLVFERSMLRQNRSNDEVNHLIELPEVARRFRVKQEVMYSLVRLGILPVVSVRKGRRSTQMCTLTMLTEFREQYVFARDLAKVLHTSSRSIICYVFEMGVIPVAGGPDDECRQVLFRKADLLEKRLLPSVLTVEDDQF